jgi:hypothetical protein
MLQAAGRGGHQQHNGDPVCLHIERRLLLSGKRFIVSGLHKNQRAADAIVAVTQQFNQERQIAAQVKKTPAPTPGFFFIFSAAYTE